MTDGWTDGHGPGDPKRPQLSFSPHIKKTFLANLHVGETIELTLNLPVYNSHFDVLYSTVCVNVFLSIHIFRGASHF